MYIADLFLQRHDVLYDFWLAGVWETVPDDLKRQVWSLIKLGEKHLD